jgi:hypothetical protein
MGFRRTRAAAGVSRSRRAVMAPGAGGAGSRSRGRNRVRIHFLLNDMAGHGLDLGGMVWRTANQSYM